MTAFTVLRFSKLKSWGAVGGAGSHNARLRKTDNADPNALAKNRFLIGSPGDDLATVAQARLKGQKIRKNAVYAVEGVMSASPAYFRPDSPEQYGHYDPARLKAWTYVSLNWLQRKYGDRVISAVLHLDEATPHLQFIILPTDDRGRLNCRKLFGGNRQIMADLQTEYAGAVAHLGISRGRAGSKAQHQGVAQYYAATQNLNHTRPPEIPAQADIEVPEPPGAMARLKDKNLTDYARETAARAIEEQTAKLAPALNTLTDRNDFLTAEVMRLREEQERLKLDNALLSQENEKFKAEAKKLRDLPLAMVLTKMFGATEARDSRPHAKRFELPDNGIIIVKGNQWHEIRKDPPQWIQGKGAVNLVMHLSGYGQERYKQAVRDMSVFFNEQETTVSLAEYLAGTASREFTSITQGQYQKPPASDTHWPEVRKYLVEQMQFPADIIDQAHEDGLIYSDQRKNCVILRDQDNGAFIFNTTGKQFSRNLGQNDKPFVLLGSDKSIYITDTLMEALSLKAMHPESTILATQGLRHIKQVRPYLEGQAEIFLALSRDKLSEENARNLAHNFSLPKRLLPTLGQTWHEEWRLQREQKEREKNLSVESTLHNTGTIEKVDESLKPASGMWR